MFQNLTYYSSHWHSLKNNVKMLDEVLLLLHRAGKNCKNKNQIKTKTEYFLKSSSKERLMRLHVPIRPTVFSAWYQDFDRWRRLSWFTLRCSRCLFFNHKNSKRWELELWHAVCSPVKPNKQYINITISFSGGWVVCWFNWWAAIVILWAVLQRPTMTLDMDSRHSLNNLILQLFLFLIIKFLFYMILSQDQC